MQEPSYLGTSRPFWFKNVPPKSVGDRWRGHRFLDEDGGGNIRAESGEIAYDSSREDVFSLRAVLKDSETLDLCRALVGPIAC